MPLWEQYDEFLEDITFEMQCPKCGWHIYSVATHDLEEKFLDLNAQRLVCAANQMGETDADIKTRFPCDWELNEKDTIDLFNKRNK